MGFATWAQYCGCSQCLHIRMWENTSHTTETLGQQHTWWCLLCYTPKLESIPSFPFMFLFNTHPSSPSNVKYSVNVFLIQTYKWYKTYAWEFCFYWQVVHLLLCRYFLLHYANCWHLQTKIFYSFMIFIELLERGKEIILLYKPNSSHKYLLITEK